MYPLILNNKVYAWHTIIYKKQIYIYLKKKIRVILIIELFLYAIFIVLSKTDYGLIVVLCIAIVAGLLILGNISNRIQERGEKYDIQDRDM